MTRIKDLHRMWMGDPEYRREYEALEEEFTLASAMITRKRTGLTRFARATGHAAADYVCAAQTVQGAQA